MSLMSKGAKKNLKVLVPLVYVEIDFFVSNTSVRFAT